MRSHRQDIPPPLALSPRLTPTLPSTQPPTRIIQVSRASLKVGPGPGARRVSPSLDPGLREGRVAESGPGPGPRATLAGGGAGGACRRRPSGDGSGGGGAEAGLRGQGNRARGWEPTRAGPGLAPTRVGGLERQSLARLSSLGDLGLTKPRAEWDAGRRWTLGLMFLVDPIPRLCAGANPLGGAQNPACTRTEVQL